MVMMRKEERKPTWIYLPPGKALSQCEKETSEDLSRAIGTDFKKITIENKNGEIPPDLINKSNNKASEFSVSAVPTIIVKGKEKPSDTLGFDKQSKKRK
jgi:hypothetical protein